MEKEHINKLGFNDYILTTGIIAEFDLEDNDIVRFTVENANPGNSIELYVKLDGQDNWKLVKTITGADSGRVETNSYDRLQVRCSTLDGTNVKLLGSGFKLG